MHNNKYLVQMKFDISNINNDVSCELGHHIPANMVKIFIIVQWNAYDGVNNNIVQTLTKQGLDEYSYWDIYSLFFSLFMLFQIQYIFLLYDLVNDYPCLSSRIHSYWSIWCVCVCLNESINISPEASLTWGVERGARTHAQHIQRNKRGGGDFLQCLAHY